MFLIRSFWVRGRSARSLLVRNLATGNLATGNLATGNLATGNLATGNLSVRDLSTGAAKTCAAALLLVLGLAGISGCAYSYRTPAPEPLNNTPIAQDDAMAVRQWNPTAALYQNDTVETHPNYSPLEPTNVKYEGNAVTETPLFLANTLYLPVGLFIDPPWLYQANKSLSTPPTFTAMPPLTTEYTTYPPRPEGANAPESAAPAPTTQAAAN